jgi:hypothetical protein
MYSQQIQILKSTTKWTYGASPVKPYLHLFEIVLIHLAVCLRRLKVH